jgi:hypothetical protein
MAGVADFGDAENILWRYLEKGNNRYEIITSRYWIDKEDIQMDEFEADIQFFEDNTKTNFLYGMKAENLSPTDVNHSIAVVSNTTAENTIDERSLSCV